MPVAGSQARSGEVARDQWEAFFSEFSKRNQSRATRLEIFGDLGAQEEERNLPLNGISIDERGIDAPRIEIMLGGASPDDGRHLTHTIARAIHIFQKNAADGTDEALEIEDAKGVKTLLRFESLPELKR
ncbi:MAG TPA: DUF5335 family protein [Blastocatellia bacterium]|nr:DUF5335 family protein [Blastocatellia bacterium]